MKTLRKKYLIPLVIIFLLGLLVLSFIAFLHLNRPEPVEMLPIRKTQALPTQKLVWDPAPILPSLEKELKERGLSNVADFDTAILVELKYASTDNFMDRDVYGYYKNCYLQKPAAQKLVEAQKHLEEIQPGYQLLVYDCCRPRSVQRKMWAIVKNTPEQRYVAPPNYGSQHNYGVAVDLTIADESGQALDMGTAFDFFGPLAEPRLEQAFLVEGKISKAQVANRQLLRTVMKKAGFRGIAREWWHFEAFSREFTRANFEIVE